MKRTDQKTLFNLDTEPLFPQGLVVLILRRKRYRKIQLKIDDKGQLHVICAESVDIGSIQKFISTHAVWILKTQMKMISARSKVPRVHFELGARFPYLGEYRELCTLPQKTPFSLDIKGATQTSIVAVMKKLIWKSSRSPEPEEIRAELIRFYQGEAREILLPRLEMWSEKLELYYSDVKLKGPRTMWGSCNRNKQIMLNWKLIMCPVWVIDSVLVHELGHLKHMNHSKEFWNLVRLAYPWSGEAKIWFKENRFVADFLL